ncbi:WYL domain-containing protein [Luteolibacter luteus]|uniref:WYL domain-containing protein n=1 Tax=Luteolibacter luteus TaxID=2728835 RepID=A0A858RSX3_9BACT|nr:WYL domain-containing protein [Luteolibacter luteus]QJE99093.1 WYL domain-containing protein [Luteolibacter luteus]
MRSKPSLQQLRDAILLRRVIEFRYRGAVVKAEPRILGRGGRYGAFMLLAWQLGEQGGWQLFRFGEIHGVAILPEPIEARRPSCARLKRQIVEMDTWAIPVPD